MIDADTRSSMEMIRDSAGAIVTKGDLTRIRRLRYDLPGFDKAVWREICALGWPGLRLSEEKGGVELGTLPYCALAEELGRGLVPEPLIPATLAASLLEGGALEAHLSGERLVLPAWQDSRKALLPDGPLRIRNGAVTTRKLNVIGAAGADDFLVIGTDGVALVAADAPGVTVTPLGTQDGGHVAQVNFDLAPANVVACDPVPALTEAALASAAYLLGVIDASISLTTDYLKTRVQFGKTIGQFQILQHMAVDLKLEAEVARASVEAAAEAWDRDGATTETRAAISRAKARASDAALKVTRDCVQLHGGIGFTDEHDIGLYLRKAMVLASQFGSASAHRALFLDLKPIREVA